MSDRFRISPSPRDRWPGVEYVATEAQLVAMADRVRAVLRTLGGEIKTVRPSGARVRR